MDKIKNKTAAKAKLLSRAKSVNQKCSLYFLSNTAGI
jgi:hypothetical protein